MKMGCRITAVILAVILMLCPLSTCFAASEIVTEEILYLIWETLKAWGINIVENGVSEFTENVEHWLNGTLDDYLNQEINEVLDTWITGLEWTIDNFGRRLLNGTGVTQLYLFAIWLKNQFNLSDDQTNALPTGNGQININGVIGYADAIVANYYWQSYSYIYNYDIIKSNTDYPVFFYAYVSTLAGTQKACVGAYSETPFMVQVTIYNSGTDTTNYQNYLAEEYNGYYFVDLVAGSNLNYWNAYNNRNTKPYGENPYLNNYSLTECKTLLAGQLIPAGEADVNINTGTISFPPGDPSYQTGYSMIYYDDGSVAYLDINWPDSISADNLPAVVSTGSISDPEIRSVWLPVRAFVNYFKSGFDIMTQIIYRMPDEIVSMALAIMGGMIIFGTIKLMREH